MSEEFGQSRVYDSAVYKSTKSFIIFLYHTKSVNLNVNFIPFWPINLPICVATILQGSLTQFIPLNGFQIHNPNHFPRPTVLPSSVGF